ncbi:MAG: TonB-dependent receptor [Gammaproteobacteria bacterium]
MLKKIVLGAAVAAVLASASVRAAEPQPFQIPAGDLASALEAVAKQTGLQLAFEPAQLKGMHTAGVKGTLTPEQAVAELIKGTPLTIKSYSSGEMLISIPRSPPKKDGARPVTRAPDRSGAEQTGLALSSAEQRRLALEQVIVKGARQKAAPFSDANVDISRTKDDAQPYYIFDSVALEQSGATNIEDFLKQRLTMNTSALSNIQTAGEQAGNTSAINLRGLGVDKTLILVNGRRMANVFLGGAANQPDLNGIPLNAIDRIEVLPSSASGIYGGSAIGGVVNVVLKRDYAGGDVSATYDNTWDTSARRRELSASYGMALEDGKTHVMLNASWSDASSLVLRDRRDTFEKNLATILENSSDFIYAPTNPFLGSLPNITGFGSPLTLKNGVSLGSTSTHVSAGTSSATSAADLAASLLKNSGTWDFNLPASTQNPSGLLSQIGAAPETKSVMFSARRQMSSHIEMFLDLYGTDNETRAIYNSNGSRLIVPDSSPANPFTGFVGISNPDASAAPMTTRSQSRSATVGAVAQLPFSWTGELDYSWSDNRYRFDSFSVDSTAESADLASGALNPFVDTLMYPLNLQKYLVATTYSSSSTLNNLALRGSGPLPSLPWGKPVLTLGVEHLITRVPENVQDVNYPLTPASDQRTTYFARHQSTNSAYAEMTMPLIKENWLPAIHVLELQLSGRTEHYKVDTGTPNYTEYPNDPESSYYSGVTLNGGPYRSSTTYTSTNGTFGLLYQPVPELILRGSIANAFLPPSPYQLVKNPVADSFRRTVLDPKTGSQVAVQTFSGGNPDLQPQSSRSTNLGLIWKPQWALLNGLRLNAEYYRIEQQDAIGTLSAQQIVNLEGTYPSRITRDSSGNIVSVDTSSINLYRRTTNGWDLSGDYTIPTNIGAFSLTLGESIIGHLKNQYALTLPEYDAVGYAPGEGGAPRYKSSATLTWEWRKFLVGWSARYVSSYKQFGAAGGPEALQNNGGEAETYYSAPQGSDTISSQIYHDLLLGYSAGTKPTDSSTRIARYAASMLDGLSIQAGIRNVLNKAPPLDVVYAGTGYTSPYGDLRLRTFWVGVKKDF